MLTMQVIGTEDGGLLREASDGSFATERRTNLEFGTMGSYDVKDVFP
ncbi:hypothetical protein BH09MYX1_BH09MYX1_62840 [soil metagenome]